jgi:hypothetical protein
MLQFSVVILVSENILNLLFFALSFFLFFLFWKVFLKLILYVLLDL